MLVGNSVLADREQMATLENISEDVCSLVLFEEERIGTLGDTKAGSMPTFCKGEVTGVLNSFTASRRDGIQSWAGKVFSSKTTWRLR